MCRWLPTVNLADAFALPVCALIVASLVGGCSDSQRASVRAERKAERAAAPTATTLDDALAAARVTGRPVLVTCTASWCAYSQSLQDETLRDPSVARLVGQFTLAKLDATADAAACRQWEVHAFPTILLVGPEGKLLDRIVGLPDREQLCNQLRSSLHAVALRGGASAPRAF